MSFEEHQEHIFNIQHTIDNILGCPTSLKRKKGSKEDYNKVAFCSTIDNIEYLIHRSYVMDNDFGINMNEYNEMFFTTIDMLLEMNYNESELKLINFYLYGRHNEDGTTNILTDEETNEVILLDSSSDLWNLIEEIRGKR
jgi:hypothetical protein